MCTECGCLFVMVTHGYISYVWEWEVGATVGECKKSGLVMVVRRKVLEKVALITVLGFSRWTTIDGRVLPQSVWVHVCMFALVYADADTSASFDYPALIVFGARTTQALCVRARQCYHVHPVRAPHPFKMPVQLKTTALSKTTELLKTSIKAKATVSSVKAFSFQVVKKMGNL